MTATDSHLMVSQILILRCQFILDEMVTEQNVVVRSLHQNLDHAKKKKKIDRLLISAFYQDNIFLILKGWKNIMELVE